VGTYWGKPGGESEVPKPNTPEGDEEGSVQNPPTRKIIKTLKGHTIQLEDGDGDEMILIVMMVEDKKPNVIVLDAGGIKITDTNENVVTMGDQLINITDKTGNVIEMTDSAFKITSKVNFTIDASGKAMTIKAKTVDFTKAE
jgi:hypothetical protein